MCRSLRLYVLHIPAKWVSAREGLFVYVVMRAGLSKGVRDTRECVVDPPVDLISALKLRVLGELWFFAEAG